MSVFKIELPNTAPSSIPPTFVDSLVFTEDIYKLYSGAKLILKELGPETFSVFKTGQAVDITFYLREGVSYTNHMKVMGVNRLPVPQSALVSTLEVTLISSWYFESLTDTRVYRGNVGTIISQIYDLKLKRANIASDFIATSESSRVRYQISEKTQDFMKKLIRFGSSNGFPLYLYTDSRGTLNLKSLGDFINSPVKYAYTSDYVSSVDSSVSSTTSTYNTIRMKGYKLNSLSQYATSKQTTLFTSRAFVSSTSEASYSTVSNAEISNSLSSTATPQTIAYTNWAFTPQDALNSTTKDFYDRNLSLYTMNCTFDGFRLEEARLGNLVKVMLPNPPDSSTTDGFNNAGYVVQHVDYVCKGDSVLTNATLFLARY